MKTKFASRYLLIALAIVSFAVMPAMATSKKSSSSDDKRVKDYQRKLADVNQRLEQHNAGMASRYTRSRLPVTVIYREGSMPKGTALRRELAIKALSRKSKEALTD